MLDSDVDPEGDLADVRGECPVCQAILRDAPFDTEAEPAWMRETCRTKCKPAT